MAKKQSSPTIVSPAGVFAYAHVEQPDTEGKYADNKYKVTLLLEKEDEASKAFLKQVKAQYKAAIKGVRKPFDSPLRDGDERAEDLRDKAKSVTEKEQRDRMEARAEDLEGKWLMTFKSKYPPQVIDAKREPLKDGVRVFSGDLGKVGFTFYAFDRGLSLQLRAIQLLEKRNVPEQDHSSAFAVEEEYVKGSDELDDDTDDDDEDDEDDL